MYRSTIESLLIGKPFWEFWGGRLIATVVMSAIVAYTLQLFENGTTELVDTTVQNTLLAQLAESNYTPPPCPRPGSEAETHKGSLVGCISVIGIDDSDFRDIFQQRTPLNPHELRRLFDALRLAPPRVVAVDLDLSPASVEDWPARELLLNSLLALSKVTHLVMVCPQGYSTTNPGALDQAWVRRFGAEVEFASPNLSVDGLYYDRDKRLNTLGMVVASAASRKEPRDQQPLDWHQACLTLRSDVTQRSSLELIRPAPVTIANFSQAISQLSTFTDRIVLIGGKWGVSDQFHLRGQSDPYFGVSLHAWVTATELDQRKELPKSARLVLDVFIGMLFGALFVCIWERIITNRAHFGKRSLFYLLFFVLAIGLPVFWVVAAAHLAKFGIVLGAAGMVLSAAADSFLSSHETLLESQDRNDQLNGKDQSQSLYLTPVLAITLSFAIFFVTYSYGDGAWICSVCGISVGLIFGFFDHRNSIKKRRSSIDAKHQASDNFDLAVRFTWVGLKVAALAWAISNPEIYDISTKVLLASFIISWGLVYIGLGKYINPFKIKS